MDVGSLVSSSQIPLRCFGLEEVSTWSVLTSPRVVELFGAVREGPTVVIFMDLKPGKRSPQEKSNSFDSFLLNSVFLASVFSSAAQRDELLTGRPGPALPPPNTGGARAPAQQEGSSPGCQR